MSQTTKTILIVGGVAVGAFVLVKALSGPTLGAKPAQKTDAISVAGITGIISGLSGLFKGSGSSSLSTSGALSASDLSNIGFDTNNYSVSNGFEFTDASGNFVAG